jgi:signal transduction histidine kinase
MRDISHRRAVERLQQEFLAMASHELRNPVAGIKGTAQLMLRRGTFSESSLVRIRMQADQLGRLVEDLLLASQIQADRLEVRREIMDLVEEARTSLEVARAQAPQRSMRLEPQVNR